MSDDLAPNASPDGRNTPLSRAEVYEAEDGRPGLLLKRKDMGDGTGWEIAMVKAGMVVTGWLSDDELAAGERWKPVLPDDAAERLVAQRKNLETLQDENDALVAALKKATEMLPHAGVEVVRHIYRQALGRPAA